MECRVYSLYCVAIQWMHRRPLTQQWWPRTLDSRHRMWNPSWTWRHVYYRSIAPVSVTVHRRDEILSCEPHEMTSFLLVHEILYGLSSVLFFFFFHFCLCFELSATLYIGLLCSICCCCCCCWSTKFLQLLRSFVVWFSLEVPRLV